MLKTMLLTTIVFFALTGSLSLADDWPLHRGGAARLGRTAESLAPPLSLIWRYHTGGAISSSPAVSGNTVYFGSSDGYLYAVDTATGALKWRYDGGGTDSARGIFSSPCVDAGNVYFATRGGRLIALNATTGALLWSYARGGQNLSSPVAGNGLIYCGTGYPTKSFFAVRATDGQLAWEYPTLQYVHASPALVGNRVYFGCNDGSYRALDAVTGALAWRYDSGGGIYVSTPAVENGKLFCAPGDYNRKILSLDANTGRQLWSYSVPWEYWQDWIYVSSPVIRNGKVYLVAGCPSAILYVLDAETGAKLWEFHVGSTSPDGFYSSPVIAGNVLYVASWNGDLYALDADTGAKLWSYGLPSGTGSSPVVSNGWLYLGSNDGDLYAFSAAGAPPLIATPPGFVHAGWNLISLPGYPSNSDPLSVFAGFDPANSSLQFWRNDAEGGGYQNYGDFFGWKGPIVVGTPYWFLYSGDDRALSFQGNPIATDQVLSIPAHALAPYWAAFGLPMSHATACADLRFSTDSAPTPVDWSTAYATDLIEASALGFEPSSASYFIAGPAGGFVDRTSLEPWYGYWLLIRTPDALTIHIPYAP